MQYLSFSVWLVSLSILPSMSIHVAAIGKMSFIFMAVYYSIMCMWCVCVCVCHASFIHSSIDGHFDCFHILTIVNNFTVNIGVHVSFQISVFVLFRYIPRNEIARSHSSIYFSEKHPYFPQWLQQFTFPSTVHKDSFFSTSLVPFVICVLFDFSHSHRYEVTFHCDFDLHFPDGLVMLSTFSCAC